MRLENREMNKTFLIMKALVSAGTCPVIVAVTFFALICSPLICLTAQQKGKSAQTKQKAVKPGAAEEQARQRANALLAQMTFDEKIGQLNQLFFQFVSKGRVNERRYSERQDRFTTLCHRSSDDKPLSENRGHRIAP
jgi:hypothetical protein